MPITVQSRFSDYSAYLDEPGRLDTLIGSPKSIFIIDENVWRLYASTILVDIPADRRLLISANEDNKTFDRIEGVYERLLSMQVRKDASLVAVGGGIVQDISGFVASTLFRGIAWHLIPTTLLAQADSCIGSKSSINLGRAKNIVGTFYPPSSIALDTRFLGTLSLADFQSGLGEIFKLCVIEGRSSVEWFEANLGALLRRDARTAVSAVEKALMIKKRYIEADEFDRGIRNYLNFGHCFGHAIESATSYRIPHGQAVSVGILLADHVAVGRGLLAPAVLERHLEVVKRLISFKLEELTLNSESVLEAIGKDKKRIGEGFALVMATDEDGMTKVGDMSREEVADALEFIEEPPDEGF